MVGIGLVLLTYMIIVESEPGALPLLLILAGIGGLAVKTRGLPDRNGAVSRYSGNRPIGPGETDNNEP